MADTGLKNKLYEKMAGEQDRFRAWLAGQPPADILGHAAEYAVREDILAGIGTMALSDSQTRALLASPDTMADIYTTFSKMPDTGHMDVVLESIGDRADALIQGGVLSQADAAREEAVFLVGRASLLHLKEMQDGGFEYAVFDRQTRAECARGEITEDAICAELEPPQGFLAAARTLAVRGAGLDGAEVAQVALTSLKDFPESDIRRRSIREPETLPKNDIRFIDSRYNEQFRIPDGGTILVEYPDRTFSAGCKYLDEYHTAISGEVYHICQFAEMLERNGGTCRPEPVLEAEQAAWKIGWKAYLAVECGAGQWDYKLLDGQFNVMKSGALEAVGCSINEVRDMILAENRMGSRPMAPTDYGMLMEKAAMREQETRTEKRESVLGQLSALKSGTNEKAAPAPAKKRDGASL